MTFRALRLTGFLLLMPGLAAAQTLTGAAEWTVSRQSTDGSDGQSSFGNSFWQNYTVGYDSFILDPRLAKYDAGFSYDTSRLSLGNGQETREGSQGGLGYRLSTSLFPDRPFPFQFQMSRTNVGQSGELATSNIIRGGVPTLPGQALPDIQTRTNALAVNWQFKAEGLPHIDLGYQKSDATGDGGGYSTEQRSNALHAGVSKDTQNTRQALRYQKTSFESLILNPFNQDFSNLDYEFAGAISRRTRVTAHAGRRSAYSLFDLPPQGVDAGTGALPPLRGESDSKYLTSNLTFDPNTRLSLSLAANVEEQQASTATTTSRLATTTARFEPRPGLSVSASGIYGSQGQVIGDVPVDVMTRSGQVASSYRATVGVLDGMVSAARSIGEQTAQDGRRGLVQSWSADTSLGVLLRGVSLGGGYAYLHGDDAILDFGNYNLNRVRGSVRYNAPRFSLGGNWDRSNFDRGQGLTFTQTVQDNYSASFGYRFGDSRVRADAGGFTNRTPTEQDSTHFWGGGLESHVRMVTLTAELRQESTTSVINSLNQQNLFGFAKAEYRRRQFGVALEYRRDDRHLQLLQLANPVQYTGRQLNLRISRKFGMRI